MAPLVLLLEVEDGELGVVLEGIERLVSEQFLDVVHIGPAAQQLGGTGAAERVGRDVDCCRARGHGSTPCAPDATRPQRTRLPNPGLNWIPIRCCSTPNGVRVYNVAGSHGGLP